MSQRRLSRPLSLLLLVLLAVPAVAAPSPTPLPTPEPEDPIRILITEILPRAPQPSGAVEVRGTLRNTGSSTITDLRLRLQVGARITTRSELHDADDDRPPTQPRVSALLPGTLAPGQSIPFDLHADVTKLGLRALGVYPLDVVARGNAGDGIDGLGLAPTWLPWFGETNPRPTRIAVVWPLVDVPHRRPDGGLGDDTLAVTLSARGRLGQLVSAARAAQTPACEAGAVGPGGVPDAAPTRCEPVHVTLAVDPDLLETAQLMTKPHQVRVNGTNRPGTGTSTSTTWLAELRSLGLADRVIGLPYADPDASALSRTARGVDDLTTATALSTDVVSKLLGVTPMTSVAWPPVGPVTPAAANALSVGGARTFVLDPSAYDDEGTTPARTPRALSLFTTSATGADLAGLVLDPDLSALLVAPNDPSGRGGPRLAEQRFLAETAIVAAEAPGISRTLLLAPPRRTAVSVAAATNILRDLGRVPWLCPVSVVAAATGAATCAGEVPRGPAEPTARGTARTDSVGELSASYLRQVMADRDRGVQLTDWVITPDPSFQQPVADLKATLRRAVARAESSVGRTDPDVARTTAGWLHQQVESLTDAVVVRGGRSLLTSTKGRLSVSVENTLAVPVQVRVRFTSKTATLSNAETGLVTVQPKHSVQASVNAQAQRSGQFVVFAQILDRNGQPFGAEAEVIVRSTRYGRLALALTVAAFAVLMLAAGVRITRRALASRR